MIRGAAGGLQGSPPFTFTVTDLNHGFLFLWNTCKVYFQQKYSSLYRVRIRFLVKAVLTGCVSQLNSPHTHTAPDSELCLLSPHTCLQFPHQPVHYTVLFLSKLESSHCTSFSFPLKSLPACLTPLSNIQYILKILSYAFSFFFKSQTSVEQPCIMSFPKFL